MRQHTFFARFALGALVTIASAAPSLAAQAQQTGSDRPGASVNSSAVDRAAVAAAVTALFAAAERGQLGVLDTLYAGDSLTVIEGAGMNRTWADYRDHHLAPELKEIKGFQYRPSDIEVRLLGPDGAWAIFRYTLKGELGTRVLDLVGRGTAILERRGHRWIIRHTHTSSRARRPSDPT